MRRVVELLKTSEHLHRQFIASFFERIALGLIVAVCLVVYNCVQQREVREYSKVQERMQLQLAQSQLLTAAMPIILNDDIDVTARGVMLLSVARTESLDPYTTMSYAHRFFLNGLEGDVYTDIVSELLNSVRFEGEARLIRAFARLGRDIGREMQLSGILPFSRSLDPSKPYVSDWQREVSLLGEMLYTSVVECDCLEITSRHFFGLSVLLHERGDLNELERSSDGNLQLIAQVLNWLREAGDAGTKEATIEATLEEIAQSNGVHKALLISGLARVFSWGDVGYEVSADYQSIRIMPKSD